MNKVMKKSAKSKSGIEKIKYNGVEDGDRNKNELLAKNSTGITEYFF